MVKMRSYLPMLIYRKLQNVPWFSSKYLPAPVHPKSVQQRGEDMSSVVNIHNRIRESRKSCRYIKISIISDTAAQY